jgi:hypothetical protein
MEDSSKQVKCDVRVAAVTLTDWDRINDIRKELKLFNIIK